MKRPHGGAVDPSLLDFSVSINPLGPPQAVRSVLNRGIDLMSRYPAPDAREFCIAVAGHHGIPRECILAGNGSSDLIYLVTRLFADQKVKVLVPAFTEYEDALEAAGMLVNTEEASITFLGNPNNPDGRLLTRKEVLGLSSTLIVDEAFMDFAGNCESVVGDAAREPRLIVLRTLTKFYAMPGLRLGYLVAVPEIIAELKRLQAPWSVNALAEALGVLVLEDREYVASSRRLLAEWREELFSTLIDLGLSPTPSEANFILCRVQDAAFLCQELLSHGIVARNCDSFTGLEKNRYVRFAILRPEQNKRLVVALNEIVGRFHEVVPEHVLAHH